MSLKKKSDGNMGQLKRFEEDYWKTTDQKLMERHEYALKYITEGSVLDLGCGDGLLLLELKKRGIEGEGMDISEVAIKKCGERGIKATVFDFSSKNLPWGASEFNWVIMTDVLEHLYDPAKILKEAARVGRKLLIVVPNFNSLSARLQVLTGKVPENNTPRKGHIYWFNKKTLLRILKDSELELMKMESGPYKKDSTLAPFFSFLNKILPSLFSLNFMVIARRSE